MGKGNPNPVTKRFQPGVSGNPGGRPKEDREMKALCRAEGLNSVRTLLKIRDDQNAGKAYRIMAANSLLDRGFGKPAQSVNVTGEVPYVLLAPEPASSADEWLARAKAKGMDVPSNGGYDPGALN